MQILGLLGMYFDAAIVFVTNSLFLFRFAMAMLWSEKILETGTVFFVKYQIVKLST